MRNGPDVINTNVLLVYFSVFRVGFRGATRCDVPRETHTLPIPSSASHFQSPPTTMNTYTMRPMGFINDDDALCTLMCTCPGMDTCFCTGRAAPMELEEPHPAIVVRSAIATTVVAVPPPRPKGVNPSVRMCATGNDHRRTGTFVVPRVGAGILVFPRPHPPIAVPCA